MFVVDCVPVLTNAKCEFRQCDSDELLPDDDWGRIGATEMLQINPRTGDRSLGPPDI